MRPMSLPRSSSSEGSSASALTALASITVLPSAPPRTTNLSFPLAKADGDLRSRDGIGGVSHHGRTHEEVLDPGCVSAIKSKLGETVLGDLHGRPRLGHLVTQVVDLVHSEALVVGHDDHTGGLEHLVERRDELYSFQLFPLALSFMAEGLFTRPPLDQPLKTPTTRRQRALQRRSRACPPARFPGTGSMRSKPTWNPAYGAPNSVLTPISCRLGVLSGARMPRACNLGQVNQSSKNSGYSS